MEMVDLRSIMKWGYMKNHHIIIWVFREAIFEYVNETILSSDKDTANDADNSDEMMNFVMKFNKDTVYGLLF